MCCNSEVGLDELSYSYGCIVFKMADMQNKILLFVEFTVLKSIKVYMIYGFNNFVLIQKTACRYSYWFGHDKSIFKVQFT